jgi:hypothetical protein
MYLAQKLINITGNAANLIRCQNFKIHCSDEVENDNRAKLRKFDTCWSDLARLPEICMALFPPGIYLDDGRMRGYKK